MILDRIDNADFYAGLHPRFAKAFEIFNDETFAKKENGKYPVDGNEIYYTIQQYVTKPISEGKLEAHRKYIDIQFLLAGVELLGYAPVANLTVVEAYDKAKDIAFFSRPEKMTTVILEPGLFCILFPNDAHLPGCQVTGPAETQKVVIKIRLNEENNGGKDNAKRAGH
jgi:YhcH/YjgK/YiaL family protein